ncbi:MAG: hypothetical protein KGI08_05205 [Thaumarchaeota archaeon]|nr:hypothetical protein [Nitrososphaerota archaeon]
MEATKRPLSEIVKNKLVEINWHGCPEWLEFISKEDGTKNFSLEEMLTQLSNTILRSIEGNGYYIIEEKSYNSMQAESKELREALSDCKSRLQLREKQRDGVWRLGDQQALEKAKTALERTK